MPETSEGNQAETENKKRLLKVLSKFSQKEEIQSALGIQDPSIQPEEFWTVQRHTANQRTFSYLRSQLGQPLAVEVDELSELECDELTTKSEQLRESGLTYTQIRHWYLLQGQLEHSLAWTQRREHADLAQRCLRVLVLLEPKGAKWLKVSSAPTAFELTSRQEEAFEFPVTSAKHIEKQFLEQAVAGFEYLKAIFSAKEIKVLPGTRHK